MNAKTIFAAAALALLGTASFADEVRDYPTPSTLTRAEVKAELARAQASGEIFANDDSFSNVQPTTVVAQRANGSSTTVGLTRVEVKRELAQADSSATLRGEAYGTVQPGVSVRTRADVRAEALAAARSRVAADSYGGI